MLHNTSGSGAVCAVWGLTLNQSCYNGAVPPEQWTGTMWRALDLCHNTTPHRCFSSTNALGSNTSTFSRHLPQHSRLTTLTINFDAGNECQSANEPIIRRLCTGCSAGSRPTTTGSSSSNSSSVGAIVVVVSPQSPFPLLEVLRVGPNAFDESADLEALAVAFRNLRVLSLSDCGLTSLAALSPSSSSLDCIDSSCRSGPILHHLTKLDLSCCRNLTSLDGLGGGGGGGGGHAAPLLEDLNVSFTAISSLWPLQGCPALKILHVRNCNQLTSLDGLGIGGGGGGGGGGEEEEDSGSSGRRSETNGHAQLQEFNASFSKIQSLAPLATCSDLVKVVEGGCVKLTSLHGLEGHTRLEEVTASYSAIDSLGGLAGCANLRLLNVRNCQQLASLDSIIQLINDAGNHQDKNTKLKVLDVSSSSQITSIEALRVCSALEKVDISGCSALASLEGLGGQQQQQQEQNQIEHHQNNGHAHLKEINVSFTAVRPFYR